MKEEAGLKEKDGKLHMIITSIACVNYLVTLTDVNVKGKSLHKDQCA